VIDDQVRLVLPADPDYVRVARVAARGLGARLGMPLAAVEDLALALDETLVLLLRPEGSAGEITFTFTVQADRLVVEALSDAGLDQAWVDAGALKRFEQLVSPTVDAHTVSDDGREVHLEKRR
jgi:anti-sigma regulatory factor (Ser/Thr protein kinase)